MDPSPQVHLVDDVSRCATRMPAYVPRMSRVCPWDPDGMACSPPAAGSCEAHLQQVELLDGLQKAAGQERKRVVWADRSVLDDCAPALSGTEPRWLGALLGHRKGSLEGLVDQGAGLPCSRRAARWSPPSRAPRTSSTSLSWRRLVAGSRSRLGRTFRGWAAGTRSAAEPTRSAPV